MPLGGPLGKPLGVPYNLTETSQTNIRGIAIPHPPFFLLLCDVAKDLRRGLVLGKITKDIIISCDIAKCNIVFIVTSQS